ncbi:MoaD/ThiS family protein [Roseateles sp. P5_E7]
MTVRLKFFASLREKLGEGEALALPDGSTVAVAREAILARGDVHAEALGSKRAVRSALNQKMCAESALLADGDELAFFPPVTGG